MAARPFEHLQPEGWTLVCFRLDYSKRNRPKQPVQGCSRWSKKIAAFLRVFLFADFTLGVSFFQNLKSRILFASLATLSNKITDRKHNRNDYRNPKQNHSKWSNPERRISPTAVPTESAIPPTPSPHHGSLSLLPGSGLSIECTPTSLPSKAILHFRYHDEPAIHSF